MRDGIPLAVLTVTPAVNPLFRVVITCHRHLLHGTTTHVMQTTHYAVDVSTLFRRLLLRDGSQYNLVLHFPPPRPTRLHDIYIKSAGSVRHISHLHPSLTNLPHAFHSQLYSSSEEDKEGQKARATPLSRSK